MTADALSSVCNLGVLDSLSEASISEILESWNSFCIITETIVKGDDTDLSSYYSKFQSHVSSLCKYGLRDLVEEHFLLSLQVYFVFWRSLLFDSNLLPHFSTFEFFVVTHHLRRGAIYTEGITL